MTLRFASFNIRNGRGLDGNHLWWLRRRSTVAAVSALGADVVGLQEMFGFQRRWIAPRLPQFDFFGVGRNDGNRRGEHVPVLWRPAVVAVSEATTRWFGPTPDVAGSRWPGAQFPRTATIVDAVSDGRAFRIVNVHLDAHDAELRARSIEQLVEWIDPTEPTVILGDFNARPDSGLTDPLAAAGLTERLGATIGSDHQFTGRTTGPRLDHIHATAHWCTLSA